MLGKLFSLLLHAKSGAISGLLLLGATGALVSVSTQNGVTTITITEASPSPSASASPSASSPASPSLSSPSSTSACSDEAKALAFQVQRVDTAFRGFHTDLMKLRGQRSVADIEKADVMLKVIRQAAVEAIHATVTPSCAKTDDEDENETESDDAVASTPSLNSDRENDEDQDSDHAKTKPAPLTFTGDAASIADQAIAAMQAAFDAAKNAPASTTRSTHRPEGTKHPESEHQGGHD